MGMLCAVSFNRYGRLYYLDPGEFTPAGRRPGAGAHRRRARGGRVRLGARSGSTEETDGFPGWPGSPADDDLRRDELLRKRKAEAKVAAKKLIREHELPMKVVAVDHVLDAGRQRRRPHHDLLHRAAPGRLPLAGPRPRRHPALPGRAAPALRPRLGAGAGRHRLLRPRPVLRDVPHRLRAGHHPDGQGPGPAAQPAAHLRRLRPADVLPEVRAPAVPEVPGDRAGRRHPGDHPGGRRPGGRRTACRSDAVVVRLDADGSRCSCSRASVCGPRQAHDERYGQLTALTPRWRRARHGHRDRRLDQVRTSADCAGLAARASSASPSGSATPVAADPVDRRSGRWSACRPAAMCIRRKLLASSMPWPGEQLVDVDLERLATSR